MSKVGIIVSFIVFGTLLIIGVSLLLEHEVKSSELVEVVGVISDLDCSVGKFSSKPKITLIIENSEMNFSLFQKFSEKVSCHEKQVVKSLIGSPAVLMVLPDKSEFSWAYEVYVNNQLVYGIADARSESKVTGFILVVISIISLFFGLFKQKKIHNKALHLTNCK